MAEPGRSSAAGGETSSSLLGAGKQPLLAVALAAAAGILVDQAAHFTPWLWGSVLLLSAVGVLRRARQTWAWWVAMVVVAAAFAMHHRSRLEGFGDDDLARLCDDRWRPVVLEGRVEGVIARRPDPLARYRPSRADDPSLTTFAFAATALRQGDRWQPVSGRMQATVQGDLAELLVGDRVRIHGHVQRITAPTNPGQRDLRPLYRGRQQLTRLRIDGVDQVQTLQRGGPSWGRAISWVARRGQQVLADQLGESAGPLAAALVLGRREALPRPEQERLIETGTAHLLSVSGLHLGIVAWGALSVTLLLGWSTARQMVLVVAVCVIYAAVTGGRPPVMRALILVAVLLIAYGWGRPANPVNSLSLALLILLALNPTNLTQVGVQLSFVAVATLSVVGRATRQPLDEDPLERLIQSRRGWIAARAALARMALRRSLIVSFWVWAMTQPLLWHYFNIVAPIAVLANLLLSVPMMVALLTGLLTVILGLIAAPLAAPVALVCRAALEAMNVLIGYLAEWPLGHFWLPGPPGGWVALYYLVFAIGWVVWERRNLSHGRSVAAVGWAFWCALALLLALRPAPLPAETLETVFVDVGHGTCVVVRRGDGEVWLYDAGRMGDPERSSQPIEAVLWSLGVWRIEGIVLSHADSDHYNAVPALLHKFRVRRLVTSPGMIDDPQPGVERLRAAVRGSGVRVEEVTVGDELLDAAGRPWATVLHPPHPPLEGTDNANSVVVRIDHAGRTLLLPGDLEAPGTERVLQLGRPRPDGVLMAPHHGSLSEDYGPLVDWARPATVVVSGGERADRPEVREALGRGRADVWVTARHGAIRVRLGPRGPARVDHWDVDRWRAAETSPPWWELAAAPETSSLSGN